MSGLSRHNLSRLQQHYEKLMLVVVLLGLLASALFLVVQVYQERTALKLAQWKQPSVQPKKATPLSAGALNAKGAALTQPFQLEIGAKGLMASELRVSCINLSCAKPIPYSAAICPFCGTKQPEIIDPEKFSTTGDIPDKWKTKYGFDIHDPHVANEDPDNDGFTNFEEFRAGTDPKDPLSHPNISGKLRILGDIKKKPFKLRFMGVMTMPSGLVFQLNLRSGKTHLKKLGEEVEGYKLQAFEPAEQSPERKDVLTLFDGRETIRLVKGKAQEKFEITADLIFLIDHSVRSNVTADTVFELRDRGNKTSAYKVIDIMADGVKIRDLTSGQEMIVPPLARGEAEDVRAVEGAKVNEAVPSGTNVPPRGVPGAPKPGLE